MRVFSVPLIGGGSLDLDLTSGSVATIVGPNGAGKSALSASIASKLSVQAINRILAHRRIWLSSSSPEISASQRTSYAQNFVTWDASVDSRWRDYGDAYRAPAIIVDLIDQQNARNAQIADRVRAHVSTDGLETDGPLQLLNKLLGTAALDVSIDISATSELTCTNHKGQTYPAAEMSDGEKSALLLLADVLVSEDGSIQLIDEPERHLHRSISAPLIVALTQVRPQDSFVIFTHDLDLAQELGATGSTYVVSECQWAGKEPQAWAMEVVPATGEMPEQLRRAVLGGRRRIVFHEGSDGGIDQMLYESFLPGTNVVPVGSCTSVLRAVGGLRESQGLHWLEALGVVDKDFRREDTPEGVRHLSVHEVENVFYLPDFILHMSTIQAQQFGQDPAALESACLSALRESLQDAGVKQNILRQKRLQDARGDLQDQIQSLTHVADGSAVTLSADVPGAELDTEYDRLLEDDIEGFLRLFPIRESKARGKASRALQYASADLYERAALQQLRTDDSLRSQVRSAIGLGDM